VSEEAPPPAMPPEPPGPYGTPLEPSPPTNRVERILVGLILTLFLALWVLSSMILDKGAPAQPPPAEPVVEEPAEVPTSTWVILGIGTLCLGCGVLIGPPTLVRLRRGLEQQALDHKAGRPSGLHVGYFLVAFGGFQVALGLMAGAPDLPSLDLEQGPRAGETLTDLRLLELGPELEERTEGPSGSAAQRLVLAEAEQVRATIEWEDMRGWLEVHPAGEGQPALEITVDGEPAVGRTPLPPDATLALGPHRGRWSAPSPREILTRAVVAYTLATALLFGVLAWFGGRQLLGQLGVPLDLRQTAREAGRGLVCYLAFAPIYVGVVLFAQKLLELLELTGQDHVLVRLLAADPTLLILVVAQAVILAPLSEEVLFRGMLLQGMTRVLTPTGALAGSAFVFACVHTGWGALLPLFALGLLFGTLFVSANTKTLAGSMAAHAAHNGFTLALAMALQSGG
jgi:membrane protease YdiL (CAAX protease family)